LPGGADAGEALCTDPHVRMIAFTGSTGVGRRVGELAGKHLKKVALELGGKNSLIVLEDADLDLAASSAAWGAWLHQGQICMATGRILAHQSIAAALTARLVAKARALPVGNPALPSWVSPLRPIASMARRSSPGPGSPGSSSSMRNTFGATGLMKAHDAGLHGFRLPRVCPRALRWAERRFAGRFLAPSDIHQADNAYKPYPVD